MREANFKMMCVGFESGDQHILNGMKKGTKQAIVREFVENARDSGVKIHGCFMYGNKFETPESMNNTLNFALELEIDSAQFYPIMVSPGTEDYEYFKKEKMLATNDFSRWNDENGQHLATVIRPDFTNKQLEEFCDYSRRKFYLRPKYIFMKFSESFIDISHFKKNMRGAYVLFKHLAMRSGKPIVK